MPPAVVHRVTFGLHRVDVHAGPPVLGALGTIPARRPHPEDVNPVKEDTHDPHDGLRVLPEVSDVFEDGKFLSDRDRLFGLARLFWDPVGHVELAGLGRVGPAWLVRGALVGLDVDVVLV